MNCDLYVTNGKSQVGNATPRKRQEISCLFRSRPISCLPTGRAFPQRVGVPSGRGVVGVQASRIQKTHLYAHACVQCALLRPTTNICGELTELRARSVLRALCLYSSFAHESAAAPERTAIAGGSAKFHAWDHCDEPYRVTRVGAAVSEVVRHYSIK